MSLKALQKLLDKLEIRPSKKLGQNFLVDANQIGAIIDLVKPQAGERILEIGPGFGAMTKPLLASGCQLTAIEFDARLHEHIAQTYGKRPNLRLLHADAARVDYDDLMGDQPYRVAANLPYSASTPILAQLVESQNRPGDMYLMLQREMADRIASEPNCKTYGALSVRLQILYHVSIGRKVPRGVFYPIPEVDSAILHLAPRPENDLTPAEFKRVSAFVKAGFSQRRKQLPSLLKPLVPRDKIDATFAALGIDPTTRAEALPPDTWLALARALDA